MINFFHVRPEKLLTAKFKPPVEEEDEEDIGISVEVMENGEIMTYHFYDSASLDDFLEILNDEGRDYVLLDGDGDPIGWDWEDYEDPADDDDEY